MADLDFTFKLNQNRPIRPIIQKEEESNTLAVDQNPPNISTVLDNVDDDLPESIIPPPPEDDTQDTITIKTGEKMSPVGSTDLFDVTKTETIVPREEPSEEYVFQWNRSLKKLRADKQKKIEIAGGEEKFKQKQEEKLDEIKNVFAKEVNEGKKGAWAKSFNSLTFGYGSDLLLDTAMAFDYVLTGAEARTKDVVEAITNSYEKTDEFFNGNFLSIPKVIDIGDYIENATGNFLYKTRGKSKDVPFSLFGVESEMSFQGLDLTKEIDKNPDEYAEQFMKFFKEMIGLSEVGAVSLASKTRAVDIFGAEKVKLVPPILTKKKEQFLKEHIVEKVNQLERNVAKTAKAHNNIRNGKLFTTDEYDFNVFQMTRNANQIQDEIDAKVEDAAKNAPEIRKQLIEDFEDGLSVNFKKNRDDPEYVKVSYLDENGDLQLDHGKARAVGKSVLQDSNKVAEEVTEFLKDPFRDPKSKGLGELIGSMNTDATSFASPILNPDRFNTIVALTAKLKKSNPEKFKRTKKVKITDPETGEEKFVSKPMTIIDNLFELAVDKDIDATDLIDELDGVGLSFEDFVLSVVGSGSEAGKIMQKLSMIKRSRSTADLIQLQDKTKIGESQFKFYKGLRRFENARRGGLVSQIPTAARNLLSVGVRLPLETVGNVIDTALYNAAKPLQDADSILELTKASALAVPRGALSLVDLNNWKGSTRSLQLMFTDLNRIKVDPKKERFGTNIAGVKLYAPTTDVQEVVDFVLKRPEFVDKHNRLFDNLNDIQTIGGREELPGIMKKLKNPVGALLNEYEDFVYALNFFNRYQEHMIRRTALFGELERLTKREWGIDLLPALNKGGIKGIINDSSEYKPEKSRSFMEIMEDATDKALDMSYSESPDLSVFKFVEKVIVRTPLVGTAIAPFPRFMLSQMELMGTYMAGSLIPATKHFAHLIRADNYIPITDKKIRTKLREKGKLDSGFLGSRKLTAEEREDFPTNILKEDKDYVRGFKAFRELSTDDRQRISRNLVGLAGIYGMREYLRTQEDENGNIADLSKVDLKKLGYETDQVADITTNHPIYPAIFVANIWRLMEKTFDPEKGVLQNLATAPWGEPVADYLTNGGWKEGAKVFLGTNVRLGVGNNFMNDITDYFFSAGDAVNDIGFNRRAGKILGNLVSTIFVPMNQVNEVERAAGLRTKKIVDLNNEQSLTSGFWSEFKKPFTKLGPPSLENKRDEKLFIYAPSDKPFERTYGTLKFIGLSIVDELSDEGKFLSGLGIKDFTLPSRGERSKGALNFEKKAIQTFLPSLIESTKEIKEILEEDYDADMNPDIIDKQTYVNIFLRDYIKNSLKEFRAKVITPTIQATNYSDNPIKNHMDNLIDIYKGLEVSDRKMGALLWRNNQGNYQGALNFGNVEHLEGMLEIIAIKLGREKKLQEPRYNALNSFLKGKKLPPLEEKFRKSPQRKVFDDMKEGAFSN